MCTVAVCLAIPPVESEELVAVLALYRSKLEAFSEDDLRLVELLAPRVAASRAPAVAAEDGMAQPVAPPAPLSLVVNR